MPTSWISNGIDAMLEHDEERDPLQKQLANIEQIFKEFADQYEVAARALREGLVPDPIPSIQLEAARKVISDTYAAITEAGTPFDIEPLEETASLSDASAYLDRVLEARAEAERRRVKLEEARAIVNEVTTLRHTSGDDELASIQSATQEVINALDSEQIEVAEHLINGEHPIAMLAAYARHRDTLNDDEYDSFRETIQINYGRALLRDIDRNRILFDETEVTETLVDFVEDDSEVIEEEIQDPAQYDPISEIEIDEELLEEANIDVSDEELPPLYADYEAGEGEDTLLPFLEGDGMNFETDEMPEATINSAEEEQEEEKDND